MYQYPFELITGQGLGISRSSLKQIGSLWSVGEFGQMKSKLHYNASNGNIVIEDRPVVSMEYDIPQEVRFVYNSNAETADTAWRLAIKKFKKMPAPGDTSVVLIEDDGHETVYSAAQGSTVFYAPGFTSGIPYLAFDAASNSWNVFNPATQVTETFDSAGNLLKRTDAQGRITSFQYLNDKTITTCPSGDIFEVRGKGRDRSIYVIRGGLEQTLQAYTFEDTGVTNFVPGAGWIKYQYFGTDYRRISIISQDDGTKLGINYSLSGNQYVITKLTAGEGNVFNINYDNSNKMVEIFQGGIRSRAKLFMDDQLRLIKMIKPCGYYETIKSFPSDVFQYIYDKLGRVAQLLYPNGGVDTYTYFDSAGTPLNVLGMLKSITKADGRVFNYYYDSSQNGKASLIAVGIKDNKDAKVEVVTRYVYDYNFDGENKSHRFLRFLISPTGQVTEYRVDARNKGLIQSKRTYLEAVYPGVDFLSPNDVISLNEVERWLSQQNPQAISLEEYRYDDHGQKTETRRYANIDSKGNGMVDEEMSIEGSIWDRQGGLVQSYFKQLPDQQPEDYPASYYGFDVMHRPVWSHNALEQDSTIAYTTNPRTETKTLPNKKVETISKDTAGFVTQKQIIADGITRLTKFLRDQIGRILRIANPDNSYNYPFYDKQNRLGYLITASGALTRYITDTQNNFKQTIRYTNPLNFADITLPPVMRARADYDDLPILYLVDEQLEENPLYANEFQRSSYQFFDLTGRLAYEVDEENYVTQYINNKFNLVTCKILYTDKISQENLELLKNGRPIYLTLDISKDRIWQYYHDKSKNRIGEKDPAGYVTEYLRDQGGRIVEKKQYATPKPGINAVDEFNAARPPQADDDAHTYSFYNAKNEVILQVDAEGYVTRHEYFPCGLVRATTIYATKVDLNWYKNPSILPPLPAESDEDKIITFTYDALKREILSEDSSGPISEKKYDVIGNITYKVIHDKDKPLSTNGDDRRGFETKYNNFGEVIAEANPFITQQISVIEFSGLPPDEKAKLIAAIWEISSTKHYYDFSGLKIKTTNTLGKPTLYYYDSERRPCLEIGPTGIVKQAIYNACGDKIGVCRYANTISLTNLTGGFITPEIEQKLAALSEPLKDQIEKFDYTPRKQLHIHTDAANNQTILDYNAFKEVAFEKHPLGNTKFIIIDREYNTRGLETKTTHTGGQLKKIIFREFDNLRGKLTQLINAAAEITQQGFDRLGNRISKTLKAKNPEELDNTHKFTFDALRRLVTDTNALGALTQRKYNQKARSCQIILPEEKTDTTNVNNIFDEIVSQADSANNTQTWSHAPDGQIAVATDALQRKTKKIINTEGDISEIVNPDLTRTKNERNNAQQLTAQTLDADGLNIKTQFIPSVFGTNDTIIDPLLVHTKNIFNKRNKLSQSIKDPVGPANIDGLNLVSTLDYNAQQSELQLVKGAAGATDLWHTTTVIDDLNRPTGTLLDPDGLNIQTSKVLDYMDRPIKINDENNNPSYNWHDGLGNKRFMMDVMGTVSERIYNAERQLIAEKTYYTQIDLSKIKVSETTSIAQLQTLLTTSVSDSQVWYYYDKNGRERFTLDILTCPEQTHPTAIVKETRYDNSGRENIHIAYANFIDTTNISTFSTDSLITLMANYQSAHDNRINYCIYDGASQERFIIDPESNVIEQQFDARGNVIGKIKYAIPVTKAAELAKLQVDQVEKAILKDPVNDRGTYQVFDSANRLKYSIDAEGGVIQYTRNLNGLVAEEYCYYSRVKLPVTYAQLLLALAALPKDVTKDRVTSTEYDNAGRKTKVTDALGFTDTYKHDALDNEEWHIDRANNQTSSIYDRAKRLILKTFPVKKTTDVQLINGKLQASDAGSISYQQQLEYDNATNVTAITDAVKTSAQRTLRFGYNKNKQANSTLINGVAIDDPDKPASLSTRPETIVDIITQKVYDARLTSIAEMNENGDWTFTVTNSLGQVNYKLEPLERIDDKTYNYRVIKYSVNAFGEVEQETKLAAKLSFNPADFTTTGVPYNWLVNKLADVKEKQRIVASNDPFQEKDRNTFYHRDRNGNPTFLTNDEILYYDQDEEAVAKGTPTVRIAYNAFGEEIRRGKQLSKNVWSDTLKWLNRNGKVQAQYAPNTALIISEFNSFNELAVLTNFANTLPFIPTNDTPLQTILDALPSIKNSKDRQKVLVYSLTGNLLEENQTNVPTYIMANDVNGLPVLKEGVPIPVLSRKHTYGPTGLKTSSTLEDGTGIAYTYYDALGNTIAEAGPTYQANDKNMQPVTYTPLILYGIDAHNNTVSKTIYKNGTSADLRPDILPVPLSISPEDQSTLIQYDTKRRSLLYSQDAEGNLKAVTVTRNNKTARLYSALSSWVQINGQFQLGTPNVDETRLKRDAQERVISKSTFRNGNLVYCKRDQYNAFDDIVGQDLGSSEWLVTHRFNQNGNKWFSDADAGTVYLYNLASAEIVKIFSTAPITDANLTNVIESQLPDLFNKTTAPVADLQFYLTRRDQANRIIEKVAPELVQQNNIQNIPLQIHMINSKTKSYLAFPVPQETNVSLTNITFTPLDNSSAATTLPIERTEDGYQIDVSSLPVDMYEYKMDYFIDGNTVYQSTGTVQCITLSNLTGSNVAVKVVEDNSESILQLYGNVTNVTAVELYDADNIFVAKLPINNVGLTTFVTLTQQPSGRYTIKPVLTNGSYLAESVIFTVNTKIAAEKFYNREMLYSANMTFSDIEGTLKLNLPAYLSNKIVKLKLHYLDDNGDEHVEEELLKPEQGENNTYVNEFSEIVSEVLDVTLDVELSDEEWVPLYIKEPPTVLTKAQKRERLTFIDPAHGDIFSRKKFSYAPLHNKRTKTFLRELKEDYFEADRSETGNDSDYDSMEDLLQESKRSLTQGYGFINSASATHKAKNVSINLPQFRQLYLMPLPVLVPPQEIEFSDISLDRMAVKKTAPVTGETLKGITINVTDLPLGCYPFTNPETQKQDVFFITDGVEVFSGDAELSLPPTVKAVSCRMQHDNFDNITAITNSLNATVTMDHNHRDQVIMRVAPAVDIVLPNNQQVHAPLVDLIDINERGHVVAEMNANGNTKKLGVNLIGQVLSESLPALPGGPDGEIIRTNAHDIFKNEIAYRDARNLIAQKQFNRMNMVIFASPLGWDQASNANCLFFGYDEVLNTNSETNGLNQTTRRNHDPLHNVEERIDPTLEVTTFGWDPNREMLSENTPGGTNTWQRNGRGYVVEHEDMRGGNYTYLLDQANNTRSQRSTGGDHGHQMAMTQGMGRIRDDDQGGQYFWTLIFRVVNGAPTPGQQLDFVFTNNRVSRIIDQGTGLIMDIGYDTDDNRVSVTVSRLDGTVLRQQTSVLDLAGREIQAFDTTVTLTVALDAVGNRRSTNIKVYDKDLPSPLTQTVSNTFDAADRMTLEVVTDGRNTRTTVSTYENNLLRRQVINGIATNLFYYANGLLWQTRDDANKILTDRSYDDAGKILNAKDLSKSEAQDNQYKSNTNYVQRSIQLKNGKPQTDTIFEQLDSFGNTLQQKSTYNDDAGFHDNLTQVYSFFDRPRISRVKGTRTYKGETSGIATAGQYYNPNGAVQAVEGTRATDDNKDIRDQSSLMTTTAEGETIARFVVPTRISGPLACEAEDTRYFHTVNGQPLAGYTIYIIPGIAKQFAVHGLPAYSTGSNGGYAYVNRLESLVNLGLRKARDPIANEPFNFKTTAVTDAVNSSFPPPGLAIDIVQDGDTYDSIGVSNMLSGQKISDANGGKILEKGQQVIIPTQAVLYNRVGNYPGYNNFINLIIPAVSPHLITPMPRPEHPTFFVMLVKIVAAVAIIILAAHMAPLVLASLVHAGIILENSVATLTPLFSSLFSGVLDAGTQGLEIVTGVQKGFSATEMLTTSIAAGFAPAPGAGVFDLVKSAAETNVLDQMTALNTGAAQQFDFRSLATSIATAAVSTKIPVPFSAKLDGVGATLNQFGQNSVNAFVSAGINGIVYQRMPKASEIAAQALGTQIAESATADIVRRMDLELAAINRQIETESLRSKAAQSNKATWRRSDSQAQQEKPATRQSTATIRQKLGMDQQMAESNMSVGLDFNDQFQVTRAKRGLSNIAMNNNSFDVSQDDYFSTPSIIPNDDSYAEQTANTLNIMTKLFQDSFTTNTSYGFTSATAINLTDTESNLAESKINIKADIKVADEVIEGGDISLKIAKAVNVLHVFPAVEKVLAKGIWAEFALSAIESVYALVAREYTEIPQITLNMATAYGVYAVDLANIPLVFAGSEASSFVYSAVYSFFNNGQLPPETSAVYSDAYSAAYSFIRASQPVIENQQTAHDEYLLETGNTPPIGYDIFGYGY